MAFIKDGASGFTAGVNDQNQLRVRSVSEQANLHASERGLGWNLGTNDINITGDATLMYIKNTSDNLMVVENIIFGIGDGITYSNAPYATLLKNVTGGDIITDATPLPLAENRNFGFSDEIGADVFLGKVGGTATGGVSAARLLLNRTGRTVVPIDIVLPTSASLALTLEANISSGSANMYVGIQAYFEDVL